MEYHQDVSFFDNCCNYRISKIDGFQVISRLLYEQKMFDTKADMQFTRWEIKMYECEGNIVFDCQRIWTCRYNAHSLPHDGRIPTPDRTCGVQVIIK